jgi:hypothetical protein
MMHTNVAHRRQSGQSAVIFALLLVAFMAMLALTFDGAHGYFRRRMSQTAADAGALAGARELCITFGDADAAIAVATAYAEEHNSALIDPDAPPLIEGRVITVTTMITFTTTFANVLGVPEMTVRTQAAAGCFLPTAGANVLPVAFSCEEELIVDENGDERCAEVEFGDPNDPFGAANHDNLYIIMDSASLDDDFECAPDGIVDCDSDDDGINDVVIGGGRSWLDLDGLGGGADQLCDWIEDGFPGTVQPHTWYPGQNGTIANLFINCMQVGDPILVPVFNVYYSGTTPPVLHDEDTIPVNNGDSDWFHVITFVWFMPTCVYGGGNDSCWLHSQLAAQDWYRDSGINGSPDGNNVKSVEGFFFQGHVLGLDGTLDGGINSGVYNVQLIR